MHIAKAKLGHCVGFGEIGLDFVMRYRYSQSSVLSRNPLASTYSDIRGYWFGKTDCSSSDLNLHNTVLFINVIKSSKTRST